MRSWMIELSFPGDFMKLYSLLNDAASLEQEAKSEVKHETMPGGARPLWCQARAWYDFTFRHQSSRRQ